MGENPYNEVTGSMGNGAVKEIADVLKTTQQVYSRYEKGINEMPVRHIIELCRFYNVSADFLLDTAPDPKRKQKRGVRP